MDDQKRKNSAIQLIVHLHPDDPCSSSDLKYRNSMDDQKRKNSVVQLRDGFDGSSGMALIKKQMALGLRRYFSYLRKRLPWKHASVAGDKETAVVSTEGTCSRILRKFNKMHCHDVKGQKSRRKLKDLKLEELKSPCLGELMALQINARERKNRIRTLPGQVEECKLESIEEGRPSLSITVCGSRVLAVDLTCSICLDTFFDPVSLTCGHIFCYMCACSAGLCNSVHGLKAADCKSKCPLCRKAGVFEGAVRMSQLCKLLKRKFPEYWEERRRKEREARILEAKAYWESQCRAFVGIN